MNNGKRRVKCTMVGSYRIGKRSMYFAHIHNEFPVNDHRWRFPDVFEEDIMVDGEPIAFQLKNVCGIEDYCRRRPLSYPETDVFLLCFSLVDPGSIYNILDEWYPELNHFCPGVPIILVGTKLDIRADKDAIELLKEMGGAPIQYSQGVNLQKEIKAAKYFECSALTRQGIKEVFEEAFQTGLLYQTQKLLQAQKKKKCTILC